jgi:hypothetical protein
MKAEQDIEKQLANSQNAWDSQPTPDLWDRLETRLDEAIPANRTAQTQKLAVSRGAVWLCSSASAWVCGGLGQQVMQLYHLQSHLQPILPSRLRWKLRRKTQILQKTKTAN